MLEQTFVGNNKFQIKSTAMNHIDSFEEFLRKKKEEETLQQVNWEDRKRLWTMSIDNLFNDVQNWIGVFQKNGLLEITYGSTSITEQYIGTYNIKTLTIRLGHSTVTLNPVATLILGGTGRVDMKGPNGDALLIEQEWNNWKFVRKEVDIKLWDVNEDSFKHILQELS